MWALFYVDPADASRETGLLLPQRCLGCKARGKPTEGQTELSPLLTNVHAAHVISFAKGGPEGTDVAHAWNFVPLCAACNLDMKTEHLIDWFYNQCSKLTGPESLKFDALFEVLYRLQRGCKNLVGRSWKDHPSIVEFAEEVYKKRCSLLDGLPEMPDGGKPTFDKIGAGFKTPVSLSGRSKNTLERAMNRTATAGPSFMGTRIVEMDKGASHFLQLGREYSNRVAETSNDIRALSRVADAIPAVIHDATVAIKKAGAVKDD